MNTGFQQGIQNARLFGAWFYGLHRLHAKACLRHERLPVRIYAYCRNGNVLFPFTLFTKGQIP
jgi:hypothetical protein